MNNTHGDLLYRPISDTAATPRPNIMDHIRIEEVHIPDNLGGGHPDPVGEPGMPGPAGIPHIAPSRGEVGWICPVCGRGLAPSTSYCPCHLNNNNIVYLTGGVSILDNLPKEINCNSTPPEAHSTTTATSKVN